MSILRSLLIARDITVVLEEVRKNFHDSTRNGEAVIHQGTGSGDLLNDTEIAADRALGEEFLKETSDWAKVRRVTVEGMPPTNLERGDLWVCVDPLDGSLDFQTRRGSMGLPFTGVITVLDKLDGATFKDVIAAGVIDFRCGDHWVAWRKEDGGYETQMNGRHCTPERAEKIDLGRMVVVPEMYYPANRELAHEMFRGDKGYFRSVGSAAYEMACVANGAIAATFCLTQKQHELGAAYALVKGAGGTVCGFDGKPLDDVPFTFNVQTPAICAGNAAIADELIARAKKARLALEWRERKLTRED